MKHLFTLLSLFFTLSLSAQTVIDFESIDLPIDSFLNGNDGSGGFDLGKAFFPNTYTVDTVNMFESWSGWSISTSRDTVDPGFMNQYSSISGGGADSSETYAVYFSTGAGKLFLQNEGLGKTVSGFSINNGTYPYFVIRDGNQFSKKFGGVTGDDPDFFLLTIKGFSNGVLTTDSVDFYLADYRFDDNSQDYIVDEWTFVDLSSLGMIDSLNFQLYSSDTSTFGINTPAYFMMDNLQIEDMSTGIFQPDFAQLSFKLYPNPGRDFVVLESSDNFELEYALYDLQGREIRAEQKVLSGQRIDISELDRGHYLLKAKGGDKRGSQIFVKY
ncbi:MAG: DUF4465 domain-containing protein [Bacteroidota bacterium]